LLKRSEVDNKLKWLPITSLLISSRPLVPEKYFAGFEEYIKGIQKFKGKLKNADAVVECYRFCEKFHNAEIRVEAYIELLYSLDITDKRTQSLLSRLGEIDNRMSNASAFIEPELLKLSDEKLKELINDKRLSDYKYATERLLASKKHILSEQQEILLNNASQAFVYRDIYDQFSDSEVSHGSVKLSNGKTVKLTYGIYNKILETETREVRRNAAKAYSKQMLDFYKTIGSCYLGSFKSDSFFAKAKKFNSCLEQSLFGSNIPEVVYKTLIKNYENNLGYLKRYFLIRKNALKLDKLYSYDMWVSLSKYTPKTVTYNECFDIVLKALSVFGDNYLNILKTAKNNNWIDVMETENKTTGAFECEVYGVHPYVLLNFDHSESYASTIAHELGHAVNAYLSSENNAYITSSNPIFLAEIASTVNEVLLYNYLIEQSKNDKEKQIYYLTELIGLFNGTFFRQANFSKFEEIVHQRIDNGESTSIFDLSDIYLELSKEYGQGVLEVSKNAHCGYQGVPHFYRAFYVYKYATGIISAINIVVNILEDKNYINNYFKFLSAGCKQSPMETLKLAKIDLTSDECYKKAFSFVDKVLTKLEELTK